MTKAQDTYDGACDADCSLREAITAADDLADEIVLLPGAMRVELPGRGEDANATGDLDVTRDVTLRGAGAARSVLQALLADDRVLDVQPGAVVTGTDLTVAGGRNVPGAAAAFGGGIRTAGALTRDRAVIRDNVVDGDGTAAYGGGVYVATGQLTLGDTAIAANSAAAGIASVAGSTSTARSHASR